MNDLRGQVVVLTYWMSDCAACDEQLKALDYYYRQRRNLGLSVFVVSADDMTDRQLKAAFRGKLVHPIASIRGPFEPKGGFPTTYIIDRQGQVRHILAEPVGVDQLNQILVPLLKQPQP
jgi:peroxiredoxin